MKYRDIHKNIREISMAITYLEDELYKLKNSLHGIDEMLLDVQEKELAEERDLEDMFSYLEKQEIERVLSAVSFEIKKIA